MFGSRPDVLAVHDRDRLLSLAAEVEEAAGRDVDAALPALERLRESLPVGIREDLAGLLSRLRADLESGNVLALTGLRRCVRQRIGAPGACDFPAPQRMN
jgi:hypothetical protein